MDRRTEDLKVYRYCLIVSINDVENEKLDIVISHLALPIKI